MATVHSTGQHQHLTKCRVDLNSSTHFGFSTSFT